MFLDELRIHVESGKGGDGMSTFRREAHVPLGGPDGGNGGWGGDVIFVVTDNYNTLLDLGYDRNYRAEPGGRGGTSRKTGKNGADCTIKVPPGTIVRDENGEILADLTVNGQTWVAAKGGKGGRGNATFKSSTNQAPDIQTQGKPGTSVELFLELKLMADVGLVGFPNAGKSSLVNKISGARPKVGDYPFTTLEPILGIVPMSGFGSFVIADIPGIIEGAADGKGLGHQFLRHIERNHALLFVIDGFDTDAYDRFLILKKELKNFHAKLADKPILVALNKSDLDITPALEAFQEAGQQCYPVSAYSGEGLPELLRALEELVRPSQNKGWGKETHSGWGMKGKKSKKPPANIWDE